MGADVRSADGDGKRLCALGTRGAHVNRPSGPHDDDGPAPPAPTVLQSFLEVAADRVTPTTLRKPVVTELSHTLEDLVLHGGSVGAVLTSFQDAEHADVERKRYERLAADPRRTVAVFARGEPGPPTPVRRFRLEDDHPLTREWLLVVLTDRFSTALFARDLADRDDPEERDRRLLTVWSFDPTVVADVCMALGAATASVSDEARRTVLEAVAAHPPRVPAPGISQRVTNAMFERLDADRLRWRDTARTLRLRQQELGLRSRRAERLERSATMGVLSAPEVPGHDDPLALAAERDLELEPTDLGSWLADLVDEMHRGGVPVELTVDVSPRLDVDRDRLRRTVQSLVDNAVEAPGRTAPARVLVLEEGPVARVEVHDDGTGVPPELRMTLFEPLVSSKPAGSAGGLGLAIARWHAHAHGGSLELDRTGPDGSVFALSLPLVSEFPTIGDGGSGGGRSGPTVEDITGPAAEGRPVPVAGGAADRTAPGRATTTTGVDGAPPCALVIDDEPAIRGLLEALLRRAGWEVAAVGDRRQALAAVERGHFDVLLVDVRLGSDDGPAVLREIEERRPGSWDRTAFMTGAPPPDGTLDGRPVLKKPFQWPDLEELLQRLF